MITLDQSGDDITTNELSTGTVQAIDAIINAETGTGTSGQNMTALDMLLSGAPTQKGLVGIPAPKVFYDEMVDQFLKRDIDIRTLPTLTQYKEHNLQAFNSESDLDRVFDRYSIQVTLPEQYDIRTNNGVRHSNVIGCVVATDVTTPTIKLYHGHVNEGDGSGTWVCLNLSIFNGAGVQEVNMTNPNFQNIFSYIPVFIDRIQDENDRALQILNEWSTITYEGERLDQLLGKLAKAVVQQNSLQTAYMTAVKLLTKPISQKVGTEVIPNPYFNTAQEYTLERIYQAFTAPISKNSDRGAMATNTLATTKVFTGLLN